MIERARVEMERTFGGRWAWRLLELDGDPFFIVDQGTAPTAPDAWEEVKDAMDRHGR